MALGTQSAVASDGYAYAYGNDDFETVVTLYNRVAHLKVRWSPVKSAS